MSLVETSFPEITARDAVNMVAAQMLRRFLGTRGKEMDGKIFSLYKKLRGGASILPPLPDEKVAPVCLWGPPGQGKSSVIRAAGQMIAKEFGMNFIESPTEDYIPNENDFVLVIQEMSGENSKAEFGGIPFKKTVYLENGESTDYMGKLLNYRLAVMRGAGLSVLNLDDFTNAGQQIQNIGLSLTQRGGFQGMSLGNTFVAMTSNLGSSDFTNTSQASNALLSRMSNLYIEDTLDDWASRAQKKFNDEIADGGIIGFMRRNENYFNVMPTGKSQTFPCPRTWEAAVPIVRVAVHDAKSSGNDMSLYLDEIQRNASSVVGKEAGLALASYLRSYYIGAEPIANKLIETGILDEVRFDKAFNKSSPEATEFGFQFAAALADNTAAKILSLEKGMDNSDNKFAYIKEAIDRFTTGIFLLPNQMIGFSCDMLKTRLSLQSKFMSKTDGDISMVKNEALFVMAEVMAQNKSADVEGLEVVRDALSDVDKLDTAPSMPKKK